MDVSSVVPPCCGSADTTSRYHVFISANRAATSNSGVNRPKGIGNDNMLTIVSAQLLGGGRLLSNVAPAIRRNVGVISG
jgi:hypothetical protein